MKQVITKEDVSAAMEQLTAQGKRPTLAAIHVLLNRRGSMSTLVRLKAELDETKKLPTGDSPEALQAFRETWAKAVAAGHHQQEVVIAELRESVNTIAAENEKLEALALASQNRAQELELSKSRAESELREFREQVKADLDETRASTAQSNSKATEVLSRFADAQTKHASQVAALQAERDEALIKAHEMEIRLTRALALLEASRTPPCGNVWLNPNS